MTNTYTLMNLNGKLDCKYHVGFFFGDKPPRGSLRRGWPSSPEENKMRLKDAGVPVERGIPKCSNCDGWSLFIFNRLSLIYEQSLVILRNPAHKKKSRESSSESNVSIARR